MGDALRALRRMARAQREREAQEALERLGNPPVVVAAQEEPPAAPAPSQTPDGRVPVEFTGPLGPEVTLTAAQRLALTAAGLVVELVDGREVVLVGAGVTYAWPWGAVDQDGRPLPYLRNGKAIAPFPCADRWKWWRGGLGPDDLQAQLTGESPGGPGEE